MSKFKKVVLSLCIAIVMFIAVGFGFMLNTPDKVYNNSCEGLPATLTNNTTVSGDKSTIYTYNPQDIKIVAGTDTINYSYQPSVDSTSTATTTAYEYVFGSNMDTTMAIDLGDISGTNVNIGYVYSNSKLNASSITTGESNFTLQTLSTKGSKVYIYILVTPVDTGASTTFSTDLSWDFGEKGTLKIVDTKTGEESTQDIVKGQSLTEAPEVEVPLGGKCTWYLDKNCTIPATFPLKVQNQPLYAEILTPNLPSDWLVWSDYSSSYYVDKGSSELPSTDIVIPSVYDDGEHGEAIVSEIYNFAFEGVGITSVVLPDTIISIGGHAFRGASSLKTINIPASVYVIQGWAFYNSGLETAYFEESDWYDADQYGKVDLDFTADPAAAATYLLEDKKCMQDIGIITANSPSYPN
ncbi:MAG: leucine-rich repeat domain-containing protein [Clostridia bacterium]|nr:leucine-rich repeat domain-containing protein [Clostridia bacterium]